MSALKDMNPLEIASAVGDAVGGISTLVGLFFAVMQFGRWRTERREERRAEAAATGLAAVLAACDALGRWTTAIWVMANHTEDEEMEDHLQRLREVTGTARAVAERAVDSLHAAEVRAHVHLGEEAAALIREPTMVFWDIAREFEGYMTALENVPEHAERAQSEAMQKFFSEYGTSIGALKERAVAMLGPTARLER